MVGLPAAWKPPEIPSLMPADRQFLTDAQPSMFGVDLGMVPYMVPYGVGKFTNPRILGAKQDAWRPNVTSSVLDSLATADMRQAMIEAENRYRRHCAIGRVTMKARANA